MCFSVMVVLLSVTSLSSVSFLFLHCLYACLPARISYVQECVFDDFVVKCVVLLLLLVSGLMFSGCALYSTRLLLFASVSVFLQCCFIPKMAAKVKQTAEFRRDFCLSIICLAWPVSASFAQSVKGFHNNH